MNPNVWFREMDQGGNGSDFMEEGRQQPGLSTPLELAKQRIIFGRDETVVAVAADGSKTCYRSDPLRDIALISVRSLGWHFAEGYRFSRVEASEHD